MKQQLEKIQALFPIHPSDHPDCMVMSWSQSEIRWIMAYAAKCVEQISNESKKWDYYQELLKQNGFSGITDLLTKYHSRELENLKLQKEYETTLDALITERDNFKKWHDVVLHECMMTESCYVESDPEKSVKDLIFWHLDGYKKENDDLKIERDALLADRNGRLIDKIFESSDRKLLANHGFKDWIELLSAYDALLVEREQWMNQEPLFYATKNLNIVITAETYNCRTYIGQADYPIPLYAHPLPAQDKIGSNRTYLPFITKEIVEIIGTEPVVLIEKDSSTVSGYAWSQDAVDFCCIIPVKPAQQVQEVTIEQSKSLFGELYFSAKWNRDRNDYEVINKSNDICQGSFQTYVDAADYARFLHARLVLSAAPKQDQSTDLNEKRLDDWAAGLEW